MQRRTKVPEKTATEVLLAARRRCCLCVFLDDNDKVHKGQIAHLNQNKTDARFINLAYLCFNHHDEYDGRTSQSRGLTEGELKVYRDKLYAKNESRPASGQATEPDHADEEDLVAAEYAEVRRRHTKAFWYSANPWRFPLWQVANRPEFFAYKASNGCDGICLIERIDLPDGRIVVAAIQTAGNPGNSVTNCVEELCYQVCERFAIPANRLVWLEHYDYYEPEWNMVGFATTPPYGPFAEPKWTRMDAEAWRALGLKPRRRLTSDFASGEYESKIQKLFPWPSEAI